MDRKEYLAEYYKKNRDKLLADKKKYRATPKGKKVLKEYYKENKKSMREMQKEYGKDYRKRPEVKKRVKKWVEENRERSREIKRKSKKIYIKKYPERIKARKIANKSLLGKKCQICGSTNKLERHHWRYDKPKLFATLCKECHTIQHRRKLL